MIDAIGGTMVMVTDQKKAIEFYTKKLGFEKRIEMNAGGMSWVEVSPKGTTSTLSLFVPKEEFLGKQGYKDAKSRIGKDTWIWVNTNNIEETVKDLRSKGVSITDTQNAAWGGMCSVIQDQDGNQLALVELPKY